METNDCIYCDLKQGKYYLPFDNNSVCSKCENGEIDDLIQSLHELKYEISTIGKSLGDCQCKIDQLLQRFNNKTFKFKSKSYEQDIPHIVYLNNQNVIQEFQIEEDYKPFSASYTFVEFLKGNFYLNYSLF